jgi:hypothetical protein
MNHVLLALLIEVAGKLAPPLVELVIAAIKYLTLQLSNQSATFAEIVPLIVRGIEIDHPDWPSEQKRRYAFDAIRLLAGTHEVTLDDMAINVLIELSVAAAQMVSHEPTD